MHEPLNESSPPATGDLRIILVGTQHPGNIGAAARAMKTIGLSRLVLVAPEKPLDDAALIAKARALFAWGGLTEPAAETLIKAALSLGEGATLADVWAVVPGGEEAR